MNESPPLLSLRGALATALLGATFAAPAQTVLSGWAVLPADTFAPGPTSGQFTNPANGRVPPYVDKQPVQGFSAVLAGPTAGSFHVMPDNGFGTKANSADALLRMYAVAPDFRTAVGGSGTVGAVDFTTGAPRTGFDATTFIGLRDPDRLLSFPIVAAQANYPNGTGTIPVAPAIAGGRLLTGADLDLESVRRDATGNLWFGDEFGPFLVKTDATGKVLRSEIALPGVSSPDNPLGGTPNLARSNGFEGMAINAAGTRLYTLLEGTVTGDPAKTLRINEFSIADERYTNRSLRYLLDARGTNIGDMTAINDHEFLVIERDGTSGDPAGFKRIFKIDLDRLDANGYAEKSELVDLMNVADPDDLNRDGRTTFAFPYVTIEDLLVLDSKTLLVINDNNYPGGGGRGTGVADATEFLRLSLAQPLAVAAVPEPSTLALLAGGLGAVVFVGRRRRPR
jgi:hypothetical protein